MTPLLFGEIGTPELLIILAVGVLMFGSSKLPDLARGSGRALRIFRAEVKGLTSDDAAASPALAELDVRQAELDRQRAELDAERARLRER